MASQVLPNPQATQKCQDQHVTHTYQQDISNYCPVARQKELPKGQEHLWTERMAWMSAPPQATTPPTVPPQLCRGETEAPREEGTMETGRWEEPRNGSSRIDRQVATETPKMSSRSENSGS